MNLAVGHKLKHAIIVLDQALPVASLPMALHKSEHSQYVGSGNVSGWKVEGL
jgi:hypothetical protein